MSEWIEQIKKRKKYFDNERVVLENASQNEVSATVKINEESTQSVIKCPSCNKLLNELELVNNNRVCYHCKHHFRMNAIDRIELTFDYGSIELLDENIVSCNPINFPNYDEKLEYLMDSLKIKEAVVTGKGNILNKEVYFGIMDYRFIMGSMGSVVGEKLTRMIERATEEKKPIIIFSASGGARMQEGMISLYQMAKVVAAVDRHSQKGLLYISVLTDPTTGGVIASFASIADIIIAEPNATIGFAGKRVANNTIKEKEINDFQTSEYHFENGHIDIICERKKLAKTISDIINLYIPNLTNKVNDINYEIIKTKNKIGNSNISERERVCLARHPNRPNFQEYTKNVFDNFIELHGDRISKDDQAIIAGIGSINGIPVTAILNAKGKNLEDNVFRNFGMSGPEGYRKVVRVTKLSEKFGLPVICFIDTPGAYCGVEAEKMGQSEAIASSIRTFTKLTVPIISIVTGEGGSGGALATGVADWIFILENSIYSVISPEGCASILFKDLSKVEESAKYLKLTSDELLKLNIVDEIIPEPKGGIQNDVEASIYYIRDKLYNKLIELLQEDIKQLLAMRSDKFRNKGVYNIL